MSSSTAIQADQLTYTTAGRHRRAVAPGQIRLTLTLPDAAHRTVATEVWINGFPVPVSVGDTVIQVPAGPVRLEVRRPGMRRARPAEVEFVLAEGVTTDVVFAPRRLGFGGGLQVGPAGGHAA